MSESRNFMQLLRARWAAGHFVCVGLDSEFAKIPADERLSTPRQVMSAFNRRIVEATHDLVCAYKPNIAFYEAVGPEGMMALADTIRVIHEIAPDVPVIIDAKRADIGNTNRGYVKAVFDELGADAVTVHPYLGSEALVPFLERADKGVIVLCRTSNKGAGELQDLEVAAKEGYAPAEPLYLRVARNVRRHWNKGGNCCLVVGATYPDELRKVRDIVGAMPILIPGIGAQGGDLEKTVTAGRDNEREGMIINSSSGIIFAADPRAETQKLHDAVNGYRLA